MSNLVVYFVQQREARPGLGSQCGVGGLATEIQIYVISLETPKESFSHHITTYKIQRNIS